MEWSKSVGGMKIQINDVSLSPSSDSQEEKRGAQGADGAAEKREQSIGRGAGRKEKGWPVHLGGF